MTSPQILRHVALSATVGSCLFITSCSDNKDPVVVTDPDTGGTPTVERRLRTLDNSTAFLAALRDGLIRQAADTYPVYYLEADPQIGSPVPTVDVPASAPDAAPPAEADGSGGSDAGGQGGLVVSGTNVQEAGVDEADRVKSDGQFLYVLVEEQTFGAPPPGVPEPIIIDSLPPTTQPVDPNQDSTSAPTPLALDSPLLPPPMPSTRLRILSLSPDVPDATAEAEVALNLGGRQARGMYLHTDSSGTSAVHVVSTGFQDYWSEWQNPYAFGNSNSAVTRVDVNDAQAAAVTSGIEIDGTIVSSRRIGNHLFVATRFYPNIPGPQPYEVDAATWENTVNNVADEDLLPHFQYANSTDAPQPLVDPAGCFVADQPNDQWYSPNIITLAMINLDTLTVADSECFLGSSETLYASPNAVYLATTRWDYYNGPVDEVTIWSDQGYVDPRVDTDIHQFNISADGLDYTASGSVPGHLGWNELRMPFRMSEHDGRLRVATMSERNDPSVSPINLTVLEPNGSGELERIAVLPNESRPAHIGKPGEQLYASRFHCT